MLTVDEKLTGWRFLLFNVAVAVGNVIALSNVPGYTVLVPYAAGSLQGVNPSFGTWGTTDHMMGVVLGLPLARWLAGRYGDYRVYCWAFVAYAVFSFACATSETIWFFVPMRFLLGLAGGIILPLGQTLVLTELPEKYRVYGVAWWGVLSMAPFTLGVFMGGFWAEYVDWRMLFYSNIILGLPIAGLVFALFYGRPVKRRIVRFDAVGFALIAVTLVGVQTILNQGNDFDWFGSAVLGAVMVVVVVAFPAFILWELGERNPALDVRLFRHRNYAVATFCSVAGFLVIQGTLSVFVGQLQTLLGYTSSLAGLVYLTMAVFAAPVVSVVHLLTKHIELRYLASLNFIGFAVTLTWLGEYDKVASFDQITAPMLFFGFFLATFFAPPAAIAVQGLPGKKLIRAAEELAMLRTAFGAYGITSQAVVQFRRAPFHQLGMADQLGGRRFPSLDVLGALMSKLQDLGMSEAVSRLQVSRLMRQQSLLLALDDAFYFGAFIFVCLAAIIWLARPAHLDKPAKKPTLTELQAEELMEQP
ncbi:MFS transporter [Methylocystis echinoides]|uniref:MFS transporter n=1 Tax=Methylocystis echinoides TaxID=29468 RepID=UPI00344084F4